MIWWIFDYLWLQNILSTNQLKILEKYFYYSILSDLSYYNLTNDITWLFEDIESHIIRDKNSSYRKKQKNNKECEERIISINNKYMNKIIKNYNMCKEYLKYFKAN